MGFGVLYIIYSLHLSPTLGHGRMTHFSEGLYRMAVSQISIYLLFASLFFMVYTPPKYFILWGLKSVLYLIARGWKKFKFLGGLLYCSSCTFLVGGGGGVRPISSIEPLKTNHVNSRTVEGKIICFMCVC